MKKLFSILLVMSVLFLASPVFVFADNIDDEFDLYFDDSADGFVGEYDEYSGESLDNPGARLKSNMLKELRDSSESTYETAQADQYDGTFGTGSYIFSVVANGVKFIIGILGVLAVIMVLYAGFLWMTAGGKEDQVGKAKNIIKQAVIGIIIISFAYGIVGFVFGMLPEGDPEGIYKDDDGEYLPGLDPD